MEGTVSTQVNPLAQAEGLVNAIKNPVPAQPTPPALPEGFKAEEFNKTLKAVAGIEDYTQIPGIRAEADKWKSQYEDLQVKYGQAANELTQAKAVKPFANPFVEKVNELFKSGKDQNQINRFLFLHSQNVEAMEPSQAVQLKLKMENPTFDDEDVRTQMEEQFGALPDPADEGYKKALDRMTAKMKVAGKEAKEWLKSQMAGFDDPSALEQRQQQAQQQEAYRNAWSQVAGSIVTQDDLQLKFEMEGKEIGGQYAFAYNPKMTEQQQQQVAKMVSEYAVANNLPLEQSSIPKLQAYREAILQTMFREDFLKQMLSDAFASMQAYFIKVYSAPGATPQGSLPPTREAKAGGRAAYTPRNGFL